MIHFEDTATPKTIAMSVSQWAAIPSNPNARLGAKRRVGDRVEPESRVSAAELPGGDLVKLDGHARGELWLAAVLEAPGAVEVDVFRVKTMAEAGELRARLDRLS